MDRDEEIEILIGVIVQNTRYTLNNNIGDNVECTHAILRAAEQLQNYIYQLGTKNI